MTMTAYAAAMLYLSPGLAVAFWIATALLFRQARQQSALYRRASVLTWSVHMAIFWTANAVCRLLTDYSGPSLFFTIWATVLAVHAAAGIYTMLYALRT